jgi:hypothetical protein
VFPADVAEPEEVPEAFGIWVLNGTLESGTLDLVRPAKHATCKLPFAVWMAMAKATPARAEGEAVQQQLRDFDDSALTAADAATPDLSIQSSTHA